MTRTPSTAVAASIGIVLCLGAAAAQQEQQPVPLGTPRGQAGREQMWRAPTAEEWKKPVLVTWQRTWEDAVRVSKETGKPILVCTNMDGEIASEHYAGVRYRSPEIAKIYEPYVCVIASVYRHNPRDYDEQGNRIECPRFGHVTCGEHIWIEPGLFAKYFKNERVAPRHIMVELDGKETFDVFYAFDTRSVFDRIQKGILERRKGLTRQFRERSIVQKVASSDHRDKLATEEAYNKGDRAARRALLQAAVADPQAAPADLLRLAVYDVDVELNRLARQALVKTDSPVAIDVINEALRTPMPDDERKELIAALERLAKYHSRASTLAAVHKGLGGQSAAVDPGRWKAKLDAAQAPERREIAAVEAQLDYKATATRQRPADAAAHLELAEASLALAVDPRTSQRLARDPRTAAQYAELMYADARRAARKAVELGAKGWQVDSVLTVCDYYLGDAEAAYARAPAAVQGLPEGDQGFTSMAVLGIFAEARMRAIRAAMQAKKEWPRQWLADVHATYAVLSKHPLGTDGQVAAHYDFLRTLGAKGQADGALRAGLQRFPDSGALHERMRGALLDDRGIAGLEGYYAARLRDPDASKTLPWFAGYASIVAAEFRRRRGEVDEAEAAYGRAVELFDLAIRQNPDSRDTADHFAALALAGRARLALEGQRDERALELLLASFARKPEAGGSLDGLNQTPMDTARLLRARLVERGAAAQAGQLQQAIDGLPAIALELPEYEKAAQRAPERVFRRGKMRRPGWRDRLRASGGRR